MALNPTTGNLESLADAGYTREQIVAWFNDLASRTGATVEANDPQILINKLMGEGRYIRQLGGDPAGAFAEFEAQYIRRGAGTSHRAMDSQSGLYADVGGDPTSEPGYVETRNTALFHVNRPSPVVSAITTMGASTSNRLEPISGPVGLAYPADPVNYATMEMSPAAGYDYGLQSGIYPTATAGPGGLAATSTGAMAPAGGLALGPDNTMLYLGLAVAAIAGYYFFVK